MKLSQVCAVIIASYALTTKQPIMCWGPAGVGKSSIVKKAAKDLKIGFIDLRLTLLEPVDLRGIPVMPKSEKEPVRWALPAFLPTSGKGILFLDELVQASPSMQAAASQLILDRRIGEYVLPDGWMVVAAGNRKSDRAAVNSMPTHIANRFVHVTVDVSFDEWMAWALQNGIDMRVIAFLKWRQPLLHSFDTQSKSEAFASPRSWEFFSHLLQTSLPMDLELAKGCVGDGAASEVVGFLKVYDRMPDIDTILLNPAQAEIPGDPATLWAVTTTICERMNKDNIGKAALYFGRLKDAGRPDFAVLALKRTAHKKPELAKTRAFCEWASSLGSLIA